MMNKVTIHCEECDVGVVAEFSTIDFSLKRDPQLVALENKVVETECDGCGMHLCVQLTALFQYWDVQ